MKTLSLTLLLFFCTSGAFAADEWTKVDIGAEVAYQVLHFVDWRQTRYIAKHPDEYYEANPILGKHPSTGEVDAYFIGTALVHPLITHLLPQKCRKYWQIVTISVQTTCVVNNVSVGIKMSW